MRSKIGCYGVIALLLVTALTVHVGLDDSASAEEIVRTASEPSVPEDELAALYEAAQEEGTVSLLTSMSEAQFEPTIALFEEHYPGVNVEFVRLASAESMTRFNAEFDAGVHAYDVMTSPDIEFWRVNLEKFVPLNEADLPGGFPGTYPQDFVFDDGALAAFSLSLMGLSWNTDLVADGDVPQTYEEALDPRFEGAIISTDPVAAGATGWQFWDVMERGFGPEYLTAFGEANPTWSSGFTEAAQSLAAGEASLMIMGNGALTAALSSAGAPVETLIPPKTGASYNYILPTLNAPHPNAGRLFTWFFLQQETQADLSSNVPGYASPYGIGGEPLPEELIPLDPIGAADPSRQAELAELLGLENP